MGLLFSSLYEFLRGGNPWGMACLPDGRGKENYQKPQTIHRTGYLAKNSHITREKLGRSMILIEVPL
jgi:hypothetical protein